VSIRRTCNARWTTGRLCAAHSISIDRINRQTATITGSVKELNPGVARIFGSQESNSCRVTEPLRPTLVHGFSVVALFLIAHGRVSGARVVKEAGSIRKTVKKAPRKGEGETSGASVITLMHRHDDAFSRAESLARDASFPRSLSLSLSPVSRFLLRRNLASGNNLFFLGWAGSCDTPEAAMSGLSLLCMYALYGRGARKS